MNGKNEFDTFYEDLPENQSEQRGNNFFDNFDENVPVETPEQGSVPEEGNGQADNQKPIVKNRRHRRLEEQLEKERELRIAAEERERMATSNRGNGDSNISNQMPAEWIELMGNGPEAQKAWNIQVKLINDATQRGKEEAIAEFESRQAAQARQQQELEDMIETELEVLEDTYGVDLTSDAPTARKARHDFLKLVEKVSPKNTQGQVVSFADFGATYEMYQNMQEAKKQNPVLERQKQLASQSMQQSQGQSKPQSSHTPGFHGWKRDLGIS